MSPYILVSVSNARPGRYAMTLKSGMTATATSGPTRQEDLGTAVEESLTQDRVEDLLKRRILLLLSIPFYPP